jgi:hypothetical protein
LYKINKSSRVFVVETDRNNSFIVLLNTVWLERKNREYQFRCSWFDPTENRIRDLQHSRLVLTNYYTAKPVSWCVLITISDSIDMTMKWSTLIAEADARFSSMPLINRSQVNICSVRSYNDRRLQNKFINFENRRSKLIS